LMTAVFSRITIVELDLPSSASTAASAPRFRLEVIVRKEGFELTNGSALIATIPKKDGEHDLTALGDLALSLKHSDPDAHDATVLLQRDIGYDNLIEVMDVIRSVELPANSELLTGLVPAETAAPAAPDAAAHAATLGYAKAAPPRTVRVALFKDIAVG